MPNPADWFQLARGKNCPFDRPRPDSTESWDEIWALRVSTLYLLRNQTYRGHCILTFDPRHAARPDELSHDEWISYSRDLRSATRAVMAACRPDHINVELLGNQVPHLHWHVIPRYRDDPRWGSAIWTTTAEELRHTVLNDDDREGLISNIRAALRDLSDT